MRELAVKLSLASAAVLLGVGVLTACGSSDEDPAATPADQATTDGGTTTTTSGSTEWCEALGSSGDDLKSALAVGVPADMPADAKAGLEFLAENEDQWEDLDTIDPTMAMDHMDELLALSGYMLTACMPDMESMMSDLPTDLDLESLMSDLPTDLDLESMMSDLPDMESLMSDLPTDLDLESLLSELETN
ncbi:MAG: hypothetical protein ACSLEW_05865 [Nocardioides sp.]